MDVSAATTLQPLRPGLTHGASATSSADAAGGDKAGNGSAAPTATNGAGQSPQEQKAAEQVRKLAQRDREVRAHELAHEAAGGRYTSGASFTYQRGSNGVLYAVAGEVRIDAAPVPGDPEATLRKAQIVQRAALAPAEPSAQDRQVAAQAEAMAAQARAELARQPSGATGAGTAADAQGKQGASSPGIDLYA